jgi:hypothetical protein
LFSPDWNGLGIIATPSHSINYDCIKTELDPYINPQTYLAVCHRYSGILPWMGLGITVIPSYSTVLPAIIAPFLPKNENDWPDERESQKFPKKIIKFTLIYINQPIFICQEKSGGRYNCRNDIPLTGSVSDNVGLFSPPPLAGGIQNPTHSNCS